MKAKGICDICSNTLSITMKTDNGNTTLVLYCSRCGSTMTLELRELGVK